jgi:hypothetical protein
MDALLNAPDQSTQQGCWDRTLLLFLYNTGARADEVAQIKIADLLFAHSNRDHSLAQIRGKGNKLRRCPLWPQTVKEGDAKVYLCHVVGDAGTAEQEPPDAASLTSFKELMNGSAEGYCPIECVVEHGEVAGAVLGLAWVDADRDVSIDAMRKGSETRGPEGR